MGLTFGIAMASDNLSFGDEDHFELEPSGFAIRLQASVRAEIFYNSKWSGVCPQKYCIFYVLSTSQAKVSFLDEMLSGVESWEKRIKAACYCCDLRRPQSPDVDHGLILVLTLECHLKCQSYLTVSKSAICFDVWMLWDDVEG